jgi:hypothetical protein
MGLFRHGSFTKAYGLLQLTSERAAEGHLGLGRQVAEMVILRLFRGMGPGYYHMAGFWRREIPWSAKLRQLNGREFNEALRSLNPPQYRKLTQNKVPEKAILRLFGIPTPRFVGKLAVSYGLDTEGMPFRTAADLETQIRKRGLERVVFKRPEGHGGKDVHVISVSIGDIIRCAPLNDLLSDRPLAQFVSQELRLEAGEEWLVEEYFTQHTVLAGINPTSVNTVRIWVRLRRDSGEEVMTAYLRIGRQNMFVDNASSGGIVAPIDLASGELRSAQDPNPRRSTYPRHPDHGAMIEGVKLPFWNEVKSLSSKALRVFPRLNFAGLDVAIGPDGPAIIELNVVPDREGAAFTDCPNRDLMA